MDSLLELLMMKMLEDPEKLEKILSEIAEEDDGGLLNRKPSIELRPKDPQDIFKDAELMGKGGEINYLHSSISAFHQEAAELRKKLKAAEENEKKWKAEKEGFLSLFHAGNEELTSCTRQLFDAREDLIRKAEYLTDRNFELSKVREELAEANKLLAKTKKELAKAKKESAGTEENNIRKHNGIEDALAHIEDLPQKPTKADFKKCLNRIRNALASVS